MADGNSFQVINIARIGDTLPATPPRDVDALQQAMQRLADDAELRTRLGQRAAEIAQQRFGIEPMLIAMETVFKRVRI